MKENKDRYEQKKLLESKLYKVSELLMYKMDASDAKNYILAFIFYKYLSEKIEYWCNEFQPGSLEILDKDILSRTISKCHLNVGCFLYPKHLFDKVVISYKNGDLAGDESLIDRLKTVFDKIDEGPLGLNGSKRGPSFFHAVDFGSVNLGNTDKERDELVGKILVALSEIDFRLEDATADILGDAYEYLIGEFAKGAKRAGEFYTPQTISSILAKIVTAGKTSLTSVYDPTCGSGSLLLGVAKEIDSVETFYGQEINSTTYNLARMNMILHGTNKRHFDIRCGDTITSPQHMEENLKFEAVVANPPFSLSWNRGEVKKDDPRFKPYDTLAPKTKADFAFIQHMLLHLSDSGTLATVVPNGVLFRGGAEGKIRKRIIADFNNLHAVIGLPENLFFNTSIPACILVMRKDRKADDPVLFIDASKGFEKEGKNNILLPEHVKKIVDTYVNNTEIEKYSTKVTLEEIKENDYNLNIPRYVDTFEEEEPIDIDAVATEIQTLNAELQENETLIASFCKELNIKRPF